MLLLYVNTEPEIIWQRKMNTAEKHVWLMIPICRIRTKYVIVTIKNRMEDTKGHREEAVEPQLVGYSYIGKRSSGKLFALKHL